ncbi:MAG TPA: hypothetical protein EYN91_04290 [Candidatus Melainabacteria bacterium]|jgi:hypothetical protein|nr:hypothetical protein [Candidatus Melainabacteria bacterium]HIN66162.1 hypothetical protein [Candidatus Obscuribacterales bacterium]
MASDNYGPLSSILTQVLAVQWKNDRGHFEVTPEFFHLLHERVVQLETALAISNHALLIHKGEMTFDDQDELENYITEVNSEEVMFNEIGQPVVKPIDTANGGTDNKSTLTDAPVT